MISSSKNKSLLAALLITAACFLVYLKTLSFGFVWDDFGLIVKTDALRKWSNLGKFFTVPYWILATGKLVPYHRPVAPLLILLGSTFSGVQPWGYHLLNLLLFSGTAVLFYQFLKQQAFGIHIAEIATAIFILHPVNVEAVNWVCCQPTLVSGACFLVLLTLSSNLTPENSKKLLPLMGLIFFFGLCAYHSVLDLPFLVFFRDLMNKNEKPWKLRLKEYGLYVFITVLFIFYNQGVIYLFAHSFQIKPFYFDANANLVYESGKLGLLLAPLNTVLRYSESLLFPARLSPDAFFKATEISASSMASFLLIALATVLLLRSKKYSKAGGFSLLWMICGLATVSNIVPQGGLFADRYLFITIMGFALWGALIYEATLDYARKQLPNLKRLTVILGIGILVVLGLKTWQQADIWQNDFSFWFYASKLTPNKARNHYNLATWWEKTQHYREAAEEYQKTLALNPEDFAVASERLAEVMKKLKVSDTFSPKSV